MLLLLLNLARPLLQLHGLCPLPGDHHAVRHGGIGRGAATGQLWLCWRRRRRWSNWRSLSGSGRLNAAADAVKQRILLQLARVRESCPAPEIRLAGDEVITLLTQVEVANPALEPAHPSCLEVVRDAAAAAPSLLPSIASPAVVGGRALPQLVTLLANPELYCRGGGGDGLHCLRSLCCCLVHCGGFVLGRHLGCLPGHPGLCH
mmetsp:Transcript_32249/g.81429  ORF Transcript_32249/g.81429 Transcript_32249/m.81429 type:complete len:204 (-) Transcript_32249:1337-1948(-)